MVNKVQVSRNSSDLTIEDLEKRLSKGTLLLYEYFTTEAEREECLKASKPLDTLGIVLETPVVYKDLPPSMQKVHVKWNDESESGWYSVDISLKDPKTKELLFPEFIQDSKARFVITG